MKQFYRLIQGDCVQILKEMDENTIDCAVTDPPYGIAFMGKSWDRALPPTEAFAEMFRVLKPGALAFVMSSPRQDVLWRMMAMLESVGFELRQSMLFHSFASGFPKSFDVSKGIDTKFTRIEFIAEHGRKPTREELKELIKGKRKVVGYTLLNPKDKKPYPQKTDIGYHGNIKCGFQEITEPAFDLAKKWSGWKSQTGLKPAVEVILMVNKPRSERTIVDNVLKWSVGAVNVDETRIPHSESVQCQPCNFSGNFTTPLSEKKERPREYTTKGRFPANLLVSDDILDSGKITQSQGHTPKRGITGTLYKGGFKYIEREEQYFNDFGGFSRYFSLDAWWRERIKKLPEEIQKTFPFLCVPKASKSEREEGLEKYPLRMKKYRRPDEPESSAYGYNWNEERPDGSKRKPIKTRNIHPTVKPLKLLSYLITLGCPPNGVVLDPFLGSGTTMLASRLMNKNCIGIEINPEYCEIAKARCFRKDTLDKYIFKFEVI